MHSEILEGTSTSLIATAKHKDYRIKIDLSLTMTNPLA